MTEQKSPRDILIEHKEELLVFVQGLLSDWLSPEALEDYNDLMWQIQSIEASIDCQDMNEDTVYWVLGGRFLKCPLRMAHDSYEEKSCVEVDCPRFNSCGLTKGILDKYI